MHYDTAAPGLLAAAEALAERGLYVFPLKPGAKTPALHYDWEQRATRDLEKIRRCWATGPYNIGVACGPSNLLVVDCDTRKPETPDPAAPFNEPGINDGADALALLAEQHQAASTPFTTYSVSTGRGGLHLYYFQPTGVKLRNTAGKLGWLIDTRGHGGYVVGPGSVVNGNPYRAMNAEASAIEPLPHWLRILLSPPPTPARRRTARTSSAPRSNYARAVLAGELGKLLGARAGTRNDTLNAVAFTLGRHVTKGTFTEQFAQSVLLDAAAEFGEDEEAKSAETIRRALRDGIRKGRS